LAGFHGLLGALYGIFLVNLALTIVTIGFYRFWAKTRMRRYLWSAVEIEGDRLEYTGTGKELFLGFLIVALLILLPLFILPQILVNTLAPGNLELEQTVGSAQAILIFLLTPLAFYRARRYRLTRTLWRGIRGGQSGSAMQYAIKYMGFMLFNFVSLGWAFPFTRVRLAAYRMNNTRLGNGRLEFTARAGGLYGAFFIMLALFVAVFILDGLLMAVLAAISGKISATPETLTREGIGGLGGILVALNFIIVFTLPWPYLFYRRAELRYFAASTRFFDLAFEFDPPFWRFGWLVLSNWLLGVVTLGLALPVVYLRWARFMESYLRVAGEQDFAQVLQTLEPAPTTGEGLADAFDVDGF
jgi:uncharacterized membrane protein YjgN (DUF898 family)